MIERLMTTGINTSYIVLSVIILVLVWVIWLTRDKKR